LALGAIDFVAKPETLPQAISTGCSASLPKKLKCQACRRPQVHSQAVLERLRFQQAFAPCHSADRVIAIGISTGAPTRCNICSPSFPRIFSRHFVVVQHMTEGLRTCSPAASMNVARSYVHEAKSGDLLIAGAACICPGNRHMMVRRMPRGEMVCPVGHASHQRPIALRRTSCSILSRRNSSHFRRHHHDGNGRDGAEGIGAIKAAGGMTIAQSEETCVVGGMPRAAMMKGFRSEGAATRYVGSAPDLVSTVPIVADPTRQDGSENR